MNLLRIHAFTLLKLGERQNRGREGEVANPGWHLSAFNLRYQRQFPVAATTKATNLVPISPSVCLVVRDLSSRLQSHRSKGNTKITRLENNGEKTRSEQKRACLQFVMVPECRQFSSLESSPLRRIHQDHCYSCDNKQGFFQYSASSARRLYHPERCKIIRKADLTTVKIMVDVK